MNRTSLLRATAAAVAAVFIISSGSIRADVLALYNFDGMNSANNALVNATNGIVGPAVTALNMSAGDFGRNRTVANGGTIPDAGYQDVSWTIVSPATAGGTAPEMSVFPGGNDGLTGSQTIGYYINFTLAADSGFVMNLSSFAFDLGTQNNRGIAGIQTSALGFSTDGSTSIGLSGNASPGFSIAGTGAASVQTFDLSGASYQGLSDITFRMYIYSPATGNGVRLDNITVNGLVTAVPEPSALALGLMASGSILFLRRRRS